jgi:hypothetical protein
MTYYFSNLKPIIILAHCKPPFLEEKYNQLNNLISSIDRDKYFVLLSANSPIPEKIISKCNYFQQDSTNYNKPHYSFAIHLKINLALQVLRFHNFNKVLCLEYDAPTGCHEHIIKKGEDYFNENNKLRFFGHDWNQPNSANQGHWFSDIDFILNKVKPLNFSTTGSQMQGVLAERLFFSMLSRAGIQNIKIVTDKDFFFPCVRPQMFQAGGALMRKEISPGTYKYIKKDGSIY